MENKEDSLVAIRRQIEAGALDAARRALAAHLTANPHHIAAWMMMASLLDDPLKQADCYRYVLSLDPVTSRPSAPWLNWR